MNSRLVCNDHARVRLLDGRLHLILDGEAMVLEPAEAAIWRDWGGASEPSAGADSLAARLVKHGLLVQAADPEIA